MIKPEDLRIGDLVRTNRDCAFPKGTMCVVTDIRPEKALKDKKGIVSLSAIYDDDDGPWGAWCCYIEGLPLTPELLEKNGFKEEVVGEYYTKPLDNEAHPLNRYLAVELKRENWVVFIKYCRLHDCALLRKIQHVHELQHILWALGLNAELKV